MDDDWAMSPAKAPLEVAPRSSHATPPSPAPLEHQRRPGRGGTTGGRGMEFFFLVRQENQTVEDTYSTLMKWDMIEMYYMYPIIKHHIH